MGLDPNLTNSLTQGLASSLLSQLDGNKSGAAARRQIITVSGADEARAFSLEKGESAVLVDDTDDIIYIKECDSIGKSSIKAFRYEEIEMTEASGGVSRKEFDALKNDIADIKKMMEAGSGKLNSEKSKE
jgi:hypothetical protein